MGLEVFQANSIVVKVMQMNPDGSSQILDRIEVPGINLASIARLRLDWIKPEKPGGPERVQVEVTPKAGPGGVSKRVTSNLQHMKLPSGQTVVDMRLLSLKADPTFSVGSAMFDTEHVPEPSSFSFIPLAGMLMLGFRRLYCRRNFRQT